MTVETVMKVETCGLTFTIDSCDEGREGACFSVCVQGVNGKVISGGHFLRSSQFGTMAQAQWALQSLVDVALAAAAVAKDEA